METRIDRRRTTRREVDLSVEPKSGADGTPRRATSLSIDGMRIDGAMSAAPGAVVRMALQLPDNRRPLRLRGLVVDGGQQTRVAFIGLSMRMRVRIAEYLFG